MPARILIVDDDEIVLGGLAEGLEHEGFGVDRADSAAEALEQFKRRPPDLVLTDLVMNGLDGMALMRKLRDLNPDVPVVVITGHGSAANAIEALRQGAADYIQKPARASEIAHRIRAVLDTAGLRRKLSRARERQQQHRRETDRQLLRRERERAIRDLAAGVAGELLPLLEQMRRAGRDLAGGLAADHPLRGAVQQLDRALDPLDVLAGRLRAVDAPQAFRAEPLDLHHLVRKHVESEQHTERLLRSPQVRFVSTLAENPVTVSGVADPLARAVATLLDTAFGLAPRGGRVWLRTSPESAEAGREPEACLVVGCNASVDPDRLERAFEPFAFLAGSAGTPVPGLALAEAAAVVRSLGGALSIRGLDPEGFEWVLRLPRADDPGSAPRAPEPGGHEEILLVDDQDASRAASREMLEQLGYRVVEAAGSADAIETVRRRAVEGQAQPGLVLLDLVLGETLDGADACRELLAMAPSLRVVLAGGFVETGRVSEARRQGALDYVRKPFQRDTLARALRKALDGNGPRA